MLTRSERRGLSLLVLVFALGAARDLWNWRRIGESSPVTAGPVTGGEAAGIPDSETPSAAVALDVGSGSGGAAGERPRVDLNRATAEELDRLPGIGPVLAARIREHRALHGPFERPEDLLAVRGIGPRLLERLRARIRTSPVDSVGTASGHSGRR